MQINHPIGNSYIYNNQKCVMQINHAIGNSYIYNAFYVDNLSSETQVFNRIKEKLKK